MKSLPYSRDPGVAESLTPPGVVLFDWHGTLVDTLEAMYLAMDEMLPMLDGLGLRDRLLPAERSKTPEDARLVEYVRAHRQLHPRVKAERRVSRSDIFEILFGGDERSKHTAHRAFNECYRRHYGEVHPFEGGEREMLLELRESGVKIGVLSNREREFLEHELAIVEGGTWQGLFDVVVAGGDTPRRKPAPEPVFKALAAFGIGSPPGLDNWYVGDSTTDVIAAKRAGITSVFFNSARWEAAWLERYFPGSASYPHVPDVVVRNVRDFKQLFGSCRCRGAGRSVPGGT